MFHIKDILNLEEKEDLNYTEKELKKAFENVESKNRKFGKIFERIKK